MAADVADPYEWLDFTMHGIEPIWGSTPISMCGFRCEVRSGPSSWAVSVTRDVTLVRDR
jgi:hypothetical protein